MYEHALPLGLKFKMYYNKILKKEKVPSVLPILLGANLLPDHGGRFWSFKRWFHKPLRILWWFQRHADFLTVSFSPLSEWLVSGILTPNPLIRDKVWTNGQFFEKDLHNIFISPKNSVKLSNILKRPSDIDPFTKNGLIYQTINHNFHKCSFCIT